MRASVAPGGAIEVATGKVASRGSMTFERFACVRRVSRCHGQSADRFVRYVASIAAT